MKRALWVCLLMMWCAALAPALRAFRPVQEPDVKKAIFGLAVSPDGKWLATANGDGTVKLFPLSGTGEPRTLPAHKGQAVAVAFSPDNRWLATASSGDDMVKIWELSTSTAKVTINAEGVIPTSVAFSPDGKLVAFGGIRGGLRVHNAATGEAVLTLPGHTDGTWSVAFAAQGRQVLSGGGDGRAKFWDATSGEEVRSFGGHSGAVLVVLSSGERLMATAGEDAFLKLRKADGGEVLFAVEDAHAAPVGALAFSPDDKWIATGGFDNAVKLWDAATGKPLRVLSGHAEIVVALVFTPDGKQLITAGWDGTARIWNPATGALLRTIPVLVSP